MSKLFKSFISTVADGRISLCSFNFIHDVIFLAEFSMISSTRCSEYVESCPFCCVIHRHNFLEKKVPRTYDVVQRGECMRPTIEYSFFLNFLIDTALIAVIARSEGCFNLLRILSASLISAIYSLFVAVVVPSLAHPMIQLALLVLISLLIAGDSSPHKWLSISLRLIGSVMLLGGAATLLRVQTIPSVLIVLCFGLILVYVLFRTCNNRISNWEIKVFIQHNGTNVQFTALIDTGNRLEEPVSGLPVLIAESSVLSGLFPSKQPLKCRRVAFNALGGTGTIPCFRPDAIFIRRCERMIPAPNVWVAIYPGRIPGSNRALAPPCFALVPGRISDHP